MIATIILKIYVWHLTVESITTGEGIFFICVCCRHSESLLRAALHKANLVSQSLWPLKAALPLANLATTRPSASSASASPPFGLDAAASWPNGVDGVDSVDGGTKLLLSPLGNRPKRCQHFQKLFFFFQPFNAAISLFLVRNGSLQMPFPLETRPDKDGRKRGLGRSGVIWRLPTGGTGPQC